MTKDKIIWQWLAIDANRDSLPVYKVSDAQLEFIKGMAHTWHFTENHDDNVYCLNGNFFRLTKIVMPVFRVCTAEESKDFADKILDAKKNISLMFAQPTNLTSSPIKTTYMEDYQKEQQGKMFGGPDLSTASDTKADVEALKSSTGELTFGQKLVGLKFNPSGDDKVDKAKMLCAELADLLNDDNNSRETTQFSQRLFSHAICEILNAQMNVVKVLTLKY